MAGRHRECAGKTVADIETGLVAPLAEASERVDRKLGVAGGDGDDRKAAVAQQSLQVLPPRLSLAAFDNELSLDACHGRYQALGSLLQGAGKPFRVRFNEQDGDKGRRVDHHHHMPFSS
jgi:hypothetical protein